MDKEIIEYRKKHKKCRWCKWMQYFCKPMFDFGYDECVLKDKPLSCFEMIQNIQAKFCKYYKVKEDNSEISINKGSQSELFSNRTDINK